MGFSGLLVNAVGGAMKGIGGAMEEGAKQDGLMKREQLLAELHHGYDMERDQARFSQDASMQDARFGQESARDTARFGHEDAMQKARFGHDFEMADRRGTGGAAAETEDPETGLSANDARQYKSLKDLSSGDNALFANLLAKSGNPKLQALGSQYMQASGIDPANPAPAKPKSSGGLISGIRSWFGGEETSSPAPSAQPAAPDERITLEPLSADQLPGRKPSASQAPAAAAAPPAQASEGMTPRDAVISKARYVLSLHPASERPKIRQGLIDRARGAGYDISDALQ